MRNGLNEIGKLIPHRPPFLWVDRIVSAGDDVIETEKMIPADLDLFRGHYPDKPIMPGVLLCEAVFQSGAMLINLILAENAGRPDGIPVLARIESAKFKKMVRPGELARISVKLLERIGQAWILNGRMTVEGKKVLSVKFTCTIAGD